MIFCRIILSLFFIEYFILRYPSVKALHESHYLVKKGLTLLPILKGLTLLPILKGLTLLPIFRKNSA